MGKDVLAEFVVRQARSVLLPDGDAQLVDVEGGVARVRFRKGHNPLCPECTVNPEDFRDYLLSMLAQKAPHIRDVRLDVEETAE